jgi:hypothetical protein
MHASQVKLMLVSAAVGLSTVPVNRSGRRVFVHPGAKYAALLPMPARTNDDPLESQTCPNTKVLRTRAKIDDTARASGQWTGS